MKERARARRDLVVVLQRAHAGELAAALAYEGHARSLADPAEAAEVLEIGRQELEHRRCVGQMLADLGRGPRRFREAFFHRIGTLLGSLCRVSGWLAPMYGAGFLESGNIHEYEEAAGLALLAGRADFVPDLLRMAEVEWDHERYFRAKVLSRRISFLPLWTGPPPRESIAPRLDFSRGTLRPRGRSPGLRRLQATPAGQLRSPSWRGTAR
jgi:demethoxyubiquinone hydroxylase (CLK1/Coq7/Cat5 family)